MLGIPSGYEPGPPQVSESTPTYPSVPINLVDVARSLPQTSPSNEHDLEREQTPSPPPEDPSCPVKGMFCLLYLTTELGSCVLGDKIVITQESLQEFVNALSPGAYSSITRINFRSLDNCLLKPMGVYGSKEEIVRFLREIHAVDDKTAQKLLLPRNETTARGAAPILRSGLYAVRSFLSSTEEQVYVLYWPEDTTWNDQAVTSVQRNRVTFMRYLTKLCDQLVCLLSAEHSQAIAWDDEDKDDDHVSTHSEESDNVNWLHYVEVVKANDQEENVAARPGFTMSSRLLVKQPRMRLDPKILSPRLLHGETVQGFMTANFRQEEGSVERFAYDHQSASQIPLLSEDDAAWCLSETLDDNTLENFMILGPGTRFSKEYDAWKRRRKEITQRFKRTLARRQTDLHVILERDSEDTKAKLRAAVVGEVLKAFPSLRRERFLPKSGSAESADPVIDVDEVTNPLRHLFSIYPKTISTFQSSMRIANFQGEIRTAEFQSIKARILILHSLLERIKSLNGDQIGSLAEVVLHGGDKQTCLEILRNMGSWRLPKEEEMWRDAIIFASQVSDSRFLLDFKPATVADCLHDAAVSAEETAYDWLAKQIESVASTIFEQVSSTQKEGCNEQASREVKSEEDRELGILRSDFVRQIEDLSIGSRSRTIIYVDTFEVRKGSPVSCSISGRRGLLQNQEIEYHVHCLRLLADQRHNLKLDPSSIPTPILNEGPSQSFCIPSETVVKYAHLLEGDRILMCLVDSHGNVMVILEPLSRIDNAIQSRSFAKFFYQDKIGQSCLFAVDESKRMLAVYASTRMQLQIFIYDEEFKSLQGLGSPIDLLPFYNPGVSIIHICFVHGREELLLVDSGAQARIFSLITMRPKPSSLQLPQVPRAIYSSPDGSYVLVVQRRDGVPTIMAYHWSTFTCTDGIPIILPDFSVDLDSALLSSIVNRNNVHLIGLDLDSRSCRSVILDITHKPTDFTGQEWRSKALSSRGKHTVHNCLIHCHVDVWSRFPVVPVAKLQAITSSRGRQQKALVFITDDDRGSFSSHFSNIVHTFERTSRKPTGEELKNISVSTRTFPSFANQFLSSPDWPVSRFRAGEWLANLLCLIPVQIAITHRNRFVPLKDGVVSTQLEKSLLGAGVNRIVDNLSLGWYESIFQSYWASKPVKVVSSMGEQSVGNSFTLNHVVDTSFAESAMRDIEGVWMSVSPTDDALIVALDLGGIHSLERSSQEDALLVLFSTAISNLVLFQSNLALSRDISGPFQAFRSCSSMWDPASNPSLFQSTLLVTIKDIIDSDRTEVSRELSLKFQKIVMDEPEANFITRLHRGKLQIISWPVIDSKEFYKPFAYLKKKLGRQPTSHRTAGKFLHTLKILMAKLNANDWRSMSQAMAAHRASALLEILPNALETGFSKVVPELEPLKNLDTDLVIEAEDTDAQFSLIRQHTPAADCELRFTTLLKSWERIPFRQRVDESEWTSGLVQHLTRLVDLRTDHVDKWLKSNIQGFHADDTNIEDLRRTFDSAVKDLREMNQLCKWQCDNCGLICIQSRLHEGGHDCLTNHKCICYCSFCRRDLSVAIPCGQNAGHAGNHVCRVNSHLCGEPCDLVILKLQNEKPFICSGTCHVPKNEEHTVHVCEQRRCPVSCEICKRPCNGDHLHGLIPDQNHHCGQEDSCSASSTSQYTKNKPQTSEWKRVESELEGVDERSQPQERLFQPPGWSTGNTSNSHGPTPSRPFSWIYQSSRLSSSKASASAFSLFAPTSPSSRPRLAGLRDPPRFPTPPRHSSSSMSQPSTPSYKASPFNNFAPSPLAISRSAGLRDPSRGPTTPPFDYDDDLSYALRLQSEFDAEYRALTVQRTAKSTQQLSKCGICMEDTSEDSIARPDPCGHPFCRDCLRRHVSARLEEHRFPILCPTCIASTGKGKVISGEVSQSIALDLGLTDQQYNIWTEMEMTAFSVLLSCRKCQQSMFVARDEHEEAKIIVCPLPGCDHMWCKQCQRTIEIDGPKHLCDGTSELDHLMKQQGWKHCPTCKTPIQKTTGCNHMSCIAPACNTHFCYLCGNLIVRSARGQEIKNATLRHFNSNCELFEDPADCAEVTAT